LIVDTNIMLWLVAGSPRLTTDLRHRLAQKPVVFSTISIWEISIKSARHRSFEADPAEVRKALLALDWTELPFTGDHAVAVRDLPPLHADPFDRALLAQARVEGMELVTADTALIGYGAPVRGM
jgi:PIN domain nuclease of toxin-antitoxin system